MDCITGAALGDGELLSLDAFSARFYELSLARADDPLPEGEETGRHVGRSFRLAVAETMCVSILRWSCEREHIPGHDLVAVGWGVVSREAGGLLGADVVFVGAATVASENVGAEATFDALGSGALEMLGAREAHEFAREKLGESAQRAGGAAVTRPVCFVVRVPWC